MALIAARRGKINVQLPLRTEAPPKGTLFLCFPEIRFGQFAPNSFAWILIDCKKMRGENYTKNFTK